MQNARTCSSMQWELLLWLPASGTLGDDSYGVTRSSVPARCCRGRCVAASAALRACSAARLPRLSEWEICVALIWARVMCLHISCCLLHSCMCVGGWTTFPLSVEACLSWHVWLWQPRHPARSCCHMLPGFCLCCARAISPQRIIARWIWSADGTCFSSASVLPGEQTAPCWLLTTAEKRAINVILSLMCLRDQEC